MKQTSLFFTCVLGLALLMSGCRYEDGPIVSFQSPEDRLVNTWIVVAATDSDGADDKASYENWTFTFREDGTADLVYPILSIDVTLDGEWNLLDDKENLQLLLSDPTGLINFNEELYITKLTRDELWLEDPDDDDRTIQLEPQL
ncbi:MAG: hypothetical protein AAF399_04005 [Bacteroidota bacterium]